MEGMRAGIREALDRLGEILRRIEGMGYKAYRDCLGEYRGPGFALSVDYVQPDPFAPPSRVRVRVEAGFLRLPPETFSSRLAQVAAADLLARRLAGALRGERDVFLHPLGQEIIERTAVRVSAEGEAEARLFVRLPGVGRRVAGGKAWRLLGAVVPEAVREAWKPSAERDQDLFRWVRLHEDQEFLRSRLREEGWVAFLADGSILPRESGRSDRPLRRGAVPLRAPDSLARTVHLPHTGPVRGLAIPQGVTLLTGGGYHGKSTLLEALALGIYDHIPGDGRELVVSLPGTVKVRAEDGRRVEGVDISPFIRELPGTGADTSCFSTEDASGSTSQAAAISEALEAGATCLLMDEDTSATNFMIRDRRMQALISRDREPITPFIDRVRQLWKERGVSSVIVIGGSGDYLDVADTVILMDSFLPRDATLEAREVALRFPTGRRAEVGEGFSLRTGRIPLPGSFEPPGGKDFMKPKHLVDLWALEQLIDPGQERTIARMFEWLGRKADGKRSLTDLATELYRQLEERGLESLVPDPLRPPGDLVWVRPFELLGAVNRYPRLRVKPPTGIRAGQG